MTVKDLTALIGAETLTGEEGLARDTQTVYVGDLLSWVMSHASKEAVWVTVQTHMNVVAVASLLDLACVVIPESISVPAPVLEKAAEEGVAVLSCDKTSFEICGLLYQAGLTPSRK